MKRDPLRHHRAHRSENAFGDSFMERLSEKVASGMGTVGFVLVSSVIIVTWVLLNHGVHFAIASARGISTGKGFDPAPFILLNLVFSAVAFFTGALVIIAAKAEAKKNTARELADAKHREELAAENLQLLKSNTMLTVQIHRLAKVICAAVPGAEPPTDS